MNISGIDATHSLFFNPVRQSGQTTVAPEQSAGGDTVNFSAEALELARKMREESERQAGVGAESEAESEESAGASDQFAAYMKNTRSKAQSGGSAEEQIEKLEEKLQNLQNQLMNLAADENSGASGKSAQAESVQGQINALMAQIAELKSQAAEEAA